MAYGVIHRFAGGSEHQYRASLAVSLRADRFCGRVGRSASFGDHGPHFVGRKGPQRGGAEVA